jgi:CDP-diacylglycerol--glycerol-3-phosphate 3-phosphatidyltransferase
LSENSEQAAPAAEVSFGDKWLNAANLITALRAFLAPPIIVLLIYQPDLPGGVEWSTLAGAIFVLAALTDKADGYFARKYDQVTRVGEFLDPLADKLLMIPIMVTLAFVRVDGGPNLLPLWVVIVVLARELLISLFRVIGARRSISFPASWSGKVKMLSQVVVVAVILFFPTSANDAWVLVLVYAMAAVTIYSGFDYVLRARREIFSRSGSAGAS